MTNYMDIIRDVSQNRARQLTAERDAATNERHAARRAYMLALKPLTDVLRDVRQDPEAMRKVHVRLEDSSEECVEDPHIVPRGCGHYVAFPDYLYVGCDSEGFYLKRQSQYRSDTRSIHARADTAEHLIPELLSVIADMLRHR